MEGTIQIIDIIIIIGICQGIFLSFTIQRISNNNIKANTILSFLIAIATVMLIGRFLYFRYFSLRVFHWSLLVDSGVFLFGPLFFVYVKRLLIKGNRTYLLSFYHAIPFLIRSYLLIRNYKKEEKKMFSFDQGPLNYLNAFLISYACLHGLLVLLMILF